MELKVAELAWILGVRRQTIYATNKTEWTRQDLAQHIEDEKQRIKQLEERAAKYGVTSS